MSNIMRIVKSTLATATLVAGRTLATPAIAEPSTLSCGPPIAGMYFCGPLDPYNSRTSGAISYRTTGVLALKSGPSYTMRIAAYEKRGSGNVMIWEGRSNSGSLTRTFPRTVNGHTICANAGTARNDVRCYSR